MKKKQLLLQAIKDVGLQSGCVITSSEINCVNCKYVLKLNAPSFLTNIMKHLKTALHKEKAKWFIVEKKSDTTGSTPEFSIKFTVPIKPLPFKPGKASVPAPCASSSTRHDDEDTSEVKDPFVSSSGYTDTGITPAEITGNVGDREAKLRMLVDQLNEICGFDLLDSDSRTKDFLCSLRTETDSYDTDGGPLQSLGKQPVPDRDGSEQRALEVTACLSKIFKIDLLSYDNEVLESLSTLPFVTSAVRNKIERGISNSVNRRPHDRLLKATLQKFSLKYNSAAANEVSALVGGVRPSTLKESCKPDILVLPCYRKDNFMKHVRKAKGKRQELEGRGAGEWKGGNVNQLYRLSPLPSP